VSYKKCENHDSPKQKIVLKISHLLKPGNRLLLQYVEYCRGSRVNQYVDLRKTDGKYNMMRDRSIVTKPKETIRFIGPFRSCGSLLTIKLGYIIRSKTSFHNKFVLEKWSLNFQLKYFIELLYKTLLRFCISIKKQIASMTERLSHLYMNDEGERVETE